MHAGRKVNQVGGHTVPTTGGPACYLRARWTPTATGADRVAVAVAGGSEDLELLVVGLVVTVRQAAVLGLRPGQEMGVETPSDLFDRLGELTAAVVLEPTDGRGSFCGRLGPYVFDLTVDPVELAGPYDLEACVTAGPAPTRSWSFSVRQPGLDTDDTLSRLAIVLKAIGRRAGWDEAPGVAARPREWLARGWRRYGRLRRGPEVRMFATELTEYGEEEIPAWTRPAASARAVPV
jgi:hypothetical protein